MAPGFQNPELPFSIAGVLTADRSDASAPELASVVISLFDQFHPRLVSYVLSFGLTYHDAEDIAQETFLALFHHLQLGRPRSNLNGWLFRVAHNQALRRRTANQARDRKTGSPHHLAQVVCPAPSAEQQVIFRRTQRRLRAVVDSLPEQDRQCLFLRSEGLKYRQIAEVLGISLGAVSLSLSRSLARVLRSSDSE